MDVLVQKLKEDLLHGLLLQVSCRRNEDEVLHSPEPTPLFENIKHAYRYQ